jgi:hypothetical protein
VGIGKGLRLGVESWNRGIVESWNRGIVESWNRGIVESWNRGIVESWNREWVPLLNLLVGSWVFSIFIPASSELAMKFT